jgi:hypothetical protein
MEENFRLFCDDNQDGGLLSLFRQTCVFVARATLTIDRYTF